MKAVLDQQERVGEHHVQIPASVWLTPSHCVSLATAAMFRLRSCRNANVPMTLAK